MLKIASRIERRVPAARIAANDEPYSTSRRSSRWYQTRWGILCTSGCAPVASEDDDLAPAIVDRERELSVEAAEHPLAPFLPPVNEDFRVARRRERVATGHELGAQLHVVVDLAVVDDDDAPVLVRQGLCASGEIDDAQARVGEADAASGVEAVAVRTTVSDGRRHAQQHSIGHTAWCAACNSRQAAHQPVPADGCRTSATGSTSSGGACK